MNIIKIETPKIIFYEPMYQVKFCSTMGAVEDALRVLQKRRREDKHAIISLNDWFDLLELPRAVLGDGICWNSYDVIGDLTIGYSHVVIDDEPCVRLDYNYYPVWESELVTK